MPSRAVSLRLGPGQVRHGMQHDLLIPSVEESVMITPEVVGHIDPVSWRRRSSSCGSATGASSFLIGPVRRCVTGEIALTVWASSLRAHWSWATRSFVIQVDNYLPAEPG